jgi:putative lipoprotein
MRFSSAAPFAALLGSLLAARPASAQDADPWFGRDKALHFSASALIAGGAYAAGALVLDGRPARALVASGAALSAGAAKELYDMTGRGQPSWRDFTWDVIGTAVGVGVSLLVDWAIRGSSGGPDTTGQGRAALVRW